METPKEKYKTARAFKVAIADRLRALANKSGEPHLDLYRRVAIDRFLARIDWTKWSAKGGYILQRRLPKARRTQDIDLSTGDASFILSDRNVQQQALLEAFQEAARVDASDYFEFSVKPEKPLPGFGKGGLRCIVKCSLADQHWSTFQLDAIVQDETVFPQESLTGDPFLSFAGIEPLTLKVPIKEEVFAEKIHAYTLPRENENTRVKDILDLALLIEDGLNREKTKLALVGVFEIRKTHSAPDSLVAPPASWQKIFCEMVEDNHIDLTLDQAFAKTAAFYAELKLTPTI
ncbi:MAG: nucleotidyl transferase AbiEii/AbiGii toxin family protein [Candidatus Obscuribacterales bacterium]